MIGCNIDDKELAKITITLTIPLINVGIICGNAETKEFIILVLKKDYNIVLPEVDAIELERSKLSASLRYDILKRDGFKCQICGATIKDGVKLHVDHIFPVSKGGKTEPNNLRTLCDKCNLGKSDKIEE